MIYIDLLKSHIINQTQIRLQKRSRIEKSILNDIAKRVNRRLQSLTILLACVSLISLMSCSSDDTDEIDKRKEFTQIVENRSAKDLLNDLYVGSDGDIQSLARMLNVTPSSIERLRKGETEPTDKFDKRVREVAVYYFQNEQSYSKLRSILDDEWEWFDTIWHFPSHHPYWFWGVSLIIFLLGCFVHGGILIGNVIELIVMLVAWGCIRFFPPDSIEDKYIESINPAIEVLI